MTKFVQHINANMTTPQSLPDTPTFHSARPDWGQVVGDAFEGMGNIVNGLGDMKKAEDKALAASKQAEAEAAETREGNNYARELQNLVSKREQNKNRTQFEQSVRMLNDVYLSRGILKADKLASIRNSYDSGYLSLNENSRERWAKYDDEATNKIIEEMQSKHSHLKGKKRSDILRDYNRITNNLDFAIEIQNRMNTIDPAQYPEEHQRLKVQRDSFFESNVVGQVLESIADDLNDNSEYFKDPVKVEEYKQSLIAFLTRNKVAIDDASIIVESALTKTGAYSVYDNEKNIMGISKQNMADVLEYRKTRADYAINQEFPELVVLSQLVNTMSPEVYRQFSDTTEGMEVNKTIAANYVKASEGLSDFITNFADKSQSINIAQTLQRTTAPALLKGSSMVASAQAVNNVPSIREISSRDFDVVISNARGVAAVFDNPHTQATKRQLQSSNKPTEQALGIQMDNEERRAKALASAGTYLQSAHKGAQNLRYIMDNSTIFNNLRVNNAGKIVFVPGTSVAGAIGEGIAEQFAGYGQMIDEINADVAAVTGLSSQGLTDFWRSLDIPTLGEGERPQHAPAFNWTSKPVKDLSEIEENLTSEETRAESRELNKDLFSAVETPQAFGEARLSRSETLVNAHMETSKDYDGPLPESMRQELNTMRAAEDTIPDSEQIVEEASTAFEKTFSSKADSIIEESGLDLDIMSDIVGIIESNNRSDAVSNKGATGVMQIMPETYKDIAKRYDLPLDGIKDPNINKKAGEIYLAELGKKFNNDEAKVLAAYNWGPTNLSKAIKKYGKDWRKHLPNETKNYLKKYYEILSKGNW